MSPLHTAAQTRNKLGRKPVVLAPNYQFTSGTSALGIPFQLSSNLVLVPINRILVQIVWASMLLIPGLREEDELIAINGRPVTQFSLEQIRQMLKLPGKEYALRLKRGSQTLQVKLKTRRLI